MKTTFEDKIEELRRENEALRDCAHKLNAQLSKMQVDCIKYLEPYNTDCGRNWFISRVIYHLTGSEQQKAQRYYRELFHSRR